MSPAICYCLPLLQKACFGQVVSVRHKWLPPRPAERLVALLELALLERGLELLLRGFQGYCLTYTVKGPQFEETKAHIFLNPYWVELHGTISHCIISQGSMCSKRVLLLLGDVPRRL